MRRIRFITSSIICLATGIILLANDSVNPAHAQNITPVSYSMPNGDSGSYNYWDAIYNGAGSTTTDNAPLSGGTGYLTSGNLPNPLWDGDVIPNGFNGQAYQWVGWNSGTTPTITITFDLGTPTQLTNSSFYLCNGGTGGVGAGDVALPSSIDLSFSNDDVTFSNQIDTPIAPDNSDPDARWITIPTPVDDRYIQATLNYSNVWVFLGQVEFEGSSSAVPEPGAYALFTGLGLTGAAVLRRRRTR